MSSDLLNALDLSESDFLLFTSRSLISHQFVFDYLLQNFAKKGNQLVVIVLANHWPHYRSVSAKCGTNLTAIQDKQRIQVIDVLSAEEGFDWKRFESELEQRLSELSSNSVVLFDDLSLFFTLGVDFVSIYKLIHRLQDICRQKRTILSIGTHFPTEEDDEEVNRLVVSIGHKCHTLCQTDRTHSGYSPLISGCLLIHKRLQNIRKQFNYKISDRSVKLLTFGSELV